MTMPPLATAAPAPAPYEQLPDVDAHFQSRARREGELYDEVALEHLAAAGAVVEVARHKIEHYPLDARILTANGGRYLVAAHGNFDEGSGVDLQRNRNARLAGSERSERVLGAGSRTSLTCVPVRSQPVSVTVISVSETLQYRTRVKSGRQSLIRSPWKRS